VTDLVGFMQRVLADPLSDSTANKEERAS